MAQLPTTPEPDFDGLRLVPFDPTHEPGVLALLGAVYAEYGQVLELDTLDDDLPRIALRYAPPHVFRVLLDERDTLVGTVALKWHTPRRAELKRVFLARPLRGLGLGRRLVEWAAARARDGGARTLDIWSDVLFDDAHRLYERLGAVATGEERALGGANDVHERYFRLAL